MAFYPSIRDEQVLTFQIVLKNLEQDPNYLESTECPYSEVVKAFFRKAISGSGTGGGGAGEAPSLFIEGQDELMVLDEQVVKVLNDLENFGRGLTNADVTEKTAYFRVKTSLLEKLLTMRERVANLKEINDFRDTILSFMDETLTKDQISDLMKRLDGVLGIDLS